MPTLIHKYHEHGITCPRSNVLDLLSSHPSKREKTEDGLIEHASDPLLPLSGLALALSPLAIVILSGTNEIHQNSLRGIRSCDRIVVVVLVLVFVLHKS